MCSSFTLCYIYSVSNVYPDFSVKEFSVPANTMLGSKLFQLIVYNSVKLGHIHTYR